MNHADIERLIKLAGGRDMPTPEGMERARLAAHESWSRMLSKPGLPRRSRLKTMLGFALAAGIAAVGVLLWTQRPAPAMPELVARIANLTGDALLQGDRGEVIAHAALPIHTGATLTTRGGRVALTFGESLSLRIDRQTRLRFDSREQVTLLAGALYVDSGGINAVPALRIVTPAGAVRHVGTQFQVHVSGDVTVVRVREGRVLMSRASGAPADITAGDELRVSGGDLAWQRGLPSFGEDWEWSASVAPALDIENRPLAEFIAWVAREHGWQVRYGDETLQPRTLEIRLHGSLDQMESATMLERVSLVTGVPLHARDGVLWVGGK
ncbi:MAG TPA: FecR family protein [Steroidobacteraceae bacterium]|nr:FecR family protein [Steroidobacteraceae bacterium]